MAVTPRDLVWHVSSRSSEAGCKLLYTVYFSLLYTEYPDVEDIGGSLDLFYRLFYVIGRWQKAEKKYAITILRYVLYYLLTYLVSLVHTQPGTQRLLKQK